MRAKARKKLESDLAQLEAGFKDVLVIALRHCADGRWGLFGQNDYLLSDHSHSSDVYSHDDYEEVIEMAADISRLREILGYVDPHELSSRFEHYRTMRGANVPGEPKLAQQFLDEIAGDSH